MATVSVTLVTADSRELLHHTKDSLQGLYKLLDHTQYLSLLLRVRDCERDEQLGKFFR